MSQKLSVSISETGDDEELVNTAAKSADMMFIDNQPVRHETGIVDNMSSNSSTSREVDQDKEKMFEVNKKKNVYPVKNKKRTSKPLATHCTNRKSKPPVNLESQAEMYKLFKLVEDHIVDRSDSDENMENEGTSKTVEAPTPSNDQGRNLQPLAELQRINSKQKFHRRQINSKFVTKPRKLIEGETPQRPYLKELCWYDKNECGTATQVFDMIFPDRSLPNHCPWTDGAFTAVAGYCEELEKKRQETLQTYTGISEEETKFQKQLNIMERLQDFLWLIHFGKTDESLERTFRLMIQKFYCRFDQNNRLKLICVNDLSLIWNRNSSIENASVLCQREIGWKLRPVFIDGLSFIYMFLPVVKSSLPIIPTNIILKILMHFILDGHKTVIYLPTNYRTSPNQVDDQDVFQLLCNMKLIEFVNERSRKLVEKRVLEAAEKSHGIIVSPSDCVANLHSIHCIPTILKCPQKSEGFLLTTFFKESSLILRKLDDVIDLRTKKRFWKVMGMRKSDFPLEDNYGRKECDIFDLESLNDSIELDSEEPVDRAASDKREEAITESNRKLLEKENSTEDSGEYTESESDSKISKCDAVDLSKLATAQDSGIVVSISNENVASESESDSSVSSSDDEMNKQCSYQEFSNKVRIYLQSEELQVDCSYHQLTLRRQVFLICSFTHLATFHFHRYKQVQMFLLLIKRFTPQLLPHFMTKSTIFEVGVAIDSLKKKQNLTNWPIFTFTDNSTE